MSPISTVIRAEERALIRRFCDRLNSEYAAGREIRHSDQLRAAYFIDLLLDALPPLPTPQPEEHDHAD